VFSGPFVSLLLASGHDVAGCLLLGLLCNLAIAVKLKLQARTVIMLGDRCNDTYSMAHRVKQRQSKTLRHCTAVEMLGRG
jgi:hypothetical protein